MVLSELLSTLTGSTVDHRDRWNSTLLHALGERVQWGLDAIEVLLDLGADVNARDCNGRTPLHVLLEHAAAGRGSVSGALSNIALWAYGVLKWP
jgi:ankyrin repeat protein